MEPTPSRPHLPRGYGIEKATGAPGERLPWSRVSEWLTTARNYWVCTTRPDGRPHAKPVWGVWLADQLLFSTHPETITARNLQTNPALVVHPMTTQSTKSSGRPELPEEVVDRLAGLLPREEVEDALEGLDPEQITGPGGLLTQLAGRVIETALGAALSGHLGYPPGQGAAGRRRQRPQRRDAEDAADRARAGRDQDAA